MSFGPQNDSTSQRADKGAGYASASASSNMFREFLNDIGQDKGGTANQILKNLNQAVANGNSAFDALPKMKEPETTPGDRNFNVAAAMQQQKPSELAQAAEDKTLKHVA